MNGKLFVSELSTSRHIFSNYHFCRGNSNKRKSRLGVIVKGRGSYIYLNKRLNVKEGDVVFIPENIYCYSEWHGEDGIEVVYLSCFIHYDGFRYDPQLIACDTGEKAEILKICDLLGEGDGNELEAYSLFYLLLSWLLPKMEQSRITVDRTLESAIRYITDNYNKDFTIKDLAKHCCVSESTIYQLFRSRLGQTPIKYINSIKINLAIEHLENSNYSISTISSLVGFNSENHFRKVFREFTGSTPLKFRKQS